MFRVRDYSLFMPSPNAERSFRRLKLFDRTVVGLIGFIGVLCIWNLIELIKLRMIGVQDLGLVTSITNDLSTRLIWIVTATTIGVIVAREFLVGERSFSIVGTLSVILALVLVPAVMSEIQPALRTHTVRVVMYDCPKSAIVNGEIEAIGLCDPHQINGTLQLAKLDPRDPENTLEILGPSSDGQNAIAWEISGRGKYHIYLMLEHDSMETCHDAFIFSLFGPTDEFQPNECIERDGKIWQIFPRTTSASSHGGIHLVNIVDP